MPKKAPSQPNNIIGAVKSKLEAPSPNLSEEEIEQIAEEVTDPRATPETVTLAGKVFPVHFLKWKQERHFMRTIGPIFRYLMDAAAIGKFETAFAAFLTESEADLTKLCCVILTAPGRFELIQNELPLADEYSKNPDGTIRTDEQILWARIAFWLEENAKMSEMLDLVIAQLLKDKVQDSLGKLWGQGALPVKALQGLSNLSRHLSSITSS